VHKKADVAGRARVVHVADLLEVLLIPVAAAGGSLITLVLVLDAVAEGVHVAVAIHAKTWSRRSGSATTAGSAPAAVGVP
jgi:hypothetical protein